ncbi:MAG: UDP-N-acetylmuramoyl-L-alanyl-D-glutamate--2,6-diaminopimelate ligase [Vicinamibacteria bacterium]|jgi:UDP-N-acetylmuramoyl-L-alanyl-D-glutamate--2,6-diaminopimelate ligase|nr:UDP-N-acetylmuramoyl-L-alanyl-D-glutamate--2,6-diaminopimelate ligase [Vicinamibacteria bacterium]
MILAELLRHVPATVTNAPLDETITRICYDSRKAQNGALFVAIRGYAIDGNQFVGAALKKGAVAVVSEQSPQAGVPWIQVDDARAALATLAAAFHSFPAASLELIGVTGTNGKTTTAYLIEAALSAAGRRVGLLGTVQYRIAGKAVDATRTTPESSDLQALLREMVEADCRQAVMEVSSHSLALKRVHGCSFKVAIFTNLTRDHLDFHEDMENYYRAKQRLFDTYLHAEGRAIINLDDDRGAELVRNSRGRVWTFALDRKADIVVEDLSLALTGSRFRVHTPHGSADVQCPLLGRFNVSNFLGALGATLALDVPLDAAVAGLCSLTGVPGRMERIDCGQDFTVVVDYAHTDDALKKLLETVRHLKPQRVIVVFGCGGDRDRTKRPLMGAVASRLSAVAIVTSDNPRSEPPEAIVDEILRGMNGHRGAERVRIEDRREAIAEAFARAQSGDVVVIAGKGHEATQTIRDRSLPFDDRQVARELLADWRGKRRAG